MTYNYGMNEREPYCYDSQLSSIEGELSRLNDKLQTLIDIFDPSNKCHCCNKPFERCQGKLFAEMAEFFRKRTPIIGEEDGK